MELIVSLYSVQVGKLLKDKNGGLHFSYAQDWIERAGARPISLSMPLTKEHYSGDVVYNFFDNLLPDNLEIRNKIQARFNVGSGHSFDLLAAIGNDCVGAIQLSSNTPAPVSALNYNILTEQQIEQLLQGLKMAMSLKGKNTHWKWSKIQPRHFISTTEFIKYPSDKVARYYEFFVENVELAIAKVEGKIRDDFPDYVADAIFAGLRKQARKSIN